MFPATIQPRPSLHLRLATVGCASLLFLANNLAVLHAWLSPPSGYIASGMTRTIDSAQYLTWIHALQNTVILPDYHAPWLTEPALWNPFFLLIARASSLTHIQAEHLLHLITFVLYLFAAFALVFALQSFMPSRRQAFAALLVALCVVPLSSNLLLPMLISGNGNWRRLPGLREFTWTHDGFLHGLLGDPMVTLGTGAVLIAMGCLACYVRTGEIRYLYFNGLTTFFAAALHPFEVCVIVATSIAVIAWQHRTELRTAARRACIVSLPAALAVSPYALATVLHPWFEDFAKVNRWHPGSFTSLFLLCGLPLLLVAVLSFVPWKSRASTDFILQWWLGLTIFCMYVPWAPFGRHFFDGFHYVTAMLLVRQVAGTHVADLPSRKLRPGLVPVFLGVCFLVSFSPHLIYRMQAYIDGNAARPRLTTNALTPEDEAEAIKWLRVKARANELVLAPPENAPWFATIPMHSFASHPRSGISYYQSQAPLSRAFYNGGLSSSKALQIVTEYGIRWVIVPRGSPALSYVQNYQERAGFGSLIIYEIPGNTMKPYPRIRQF